MNKAVRLQVYKRDNWHCRHCNSSWSLTPHHIIHKSQGGEDTVENLVTLCITCHNAHHDGFLLVEKIETGFKFTRLLGWRPQ